MTQASFAALVPFAFFVLALLALFVSALARLDQENPRWTQSSWSWCSRSGRSWWWSPCCSW